MSGYNAPADKATVGSRCIIGFTLNLSNVDPELLRLLRSEADRRQIPVEAVAHEWLRAASVMTPRPTNLPTQPGNAHSKADAEWSDKEVAEFKATVRKVAGPVTPLPEITPEDRAKLLAMAGSWTKEEADAFDKRIEEMFKQIDEELWK